MCCNADPDLDADFAEDCAALSGDNSVHFGNFINNVSQTFLYHHLSLTMDSVLGWRTVASQGLFVF